MNHSTRPAPRRGHTVRRGRVFTLALTVMVIASMFAAAPAFAGKGGSKNPPSDPRPRP
jgi:hypothetical protein